MNEDQMTINDTLCARISIGMERANFNIKRKIIKTLNVRDNIAFKIGEKVIHLECLIDPQEQRLVSRVLIWPS